MAAPGRDALFERKLAKLQGKFLRWEDFSSTPAPEGLLGSVRACCPRWPSAFALRQCRGSSRSVRHAPGHLRVLTFRGLQGGFGEVWRVRKRVSNEEFALKVIDSNSPDILTPDVVAECARPAPAGLARLSARRAQVLHAAQGEALLAAH